jgi:acyl-CoA dehydrogenase
MRLALSAEDEVFRGEVRAFLAEHLSADLVAAAQATTSVFTEKEASIAWQKILHAKGWVAPSWPKAFGGTGWSEIQRHIFATECARADAPSLAPMGLRMVGPCIMHYGTQEQKEFYLPRILSGEDYWCQGYSEPGSGSDLASLSLRATSDGDAYVLNGTKIWTTHAHVANRMFCLVRTRTEGKPQAGITFLLLSMSTPGISVRPIITLAGDHELNQVFFDSVRVPKENRLGAENDGWSVAKYLLEFERGGGWSAGLYQSVARIRALLRRLPDDDAATLDANAGLRRRLAAAEVGVAAIEMSELRLLAALSSGSSPGPGSSLLKVQGSEMMQHLDELAIDVAERYGLIDQRAARRQHAGKTAIGPGEALTLMPRYLNNRAGSIYGGSNEIQRDIIARLVLQL